MDPQEKINLLLVDDRVDGLVTLEAVLACPEYNLVKATSGREALAALLETDFAVIILDVQMPEMDGFETAALIKQREKSRNIPILFVTAINKDPFFVFKGYDAGAVDYLFKPFEPRVLKTKVRVFAELYRKTRALSVQAQLLKNSEEQKRLIIESARDVIMTTDTAGIIKSLSPSFETIMGRNISHWIGKSFEPVVWPDDLETYKSHFNRVAQGETVLFEMRLVTALGASVFVESSSKPLVQNGVTIGTMSVVRDISERKEAERERRMRYELQRSNAELEQFAHICSHDLQEPLRTLSSLAYLLKENFDGMTAEEAKELLDGLISGATRMSTLISDLLSYSKVGSGEFPIQRTSSEKALQRALDSLAQAIESNGVEVVRDPLPEVDGNDVLLSQVFQNIIANAIKFRGNSKPRVKISAEVREGEWIFSIQDNGIGFKMDYAEKIFQLFKRLHHSEEYPGTGLGLGLCKRIIERHGGRIWARSSEGEGSTFYFSLPGPALDRRAWYGPKLVAMAGHAERQSNA